LRLLLLERVSRPRLRVGEILAGLRGHHLANALVSFLFACTGPVALILTVGVAGGLKPAEIASWISIAFGLGGVITFAMSVLYRQPLAMAWTIPGSAIVGAGLLKFPYDEIVGAYVVTGGLMLALGLSGAFKKIMDWMPQPIVMAMVAGLFLKFGLLAIDGFDKAPIVAAAATAGFALFSLLRPVGRVVPPVVAALAAGAAAIGFLGGFAPREGAAGLFADFIFFAPKFSEAALLDLVLPLAISVVVLQNAQGIGILRMNGHDPPPNTITAVCGAGSVVFGLFGSVCTCLTGPTNAILSSSGEPKNHYLGALIWAVFAVLFGLFAPGITRVALAVPDAFIYVIGGLAMLRVLQQSLAAAFGGQFTAGAVVCMAVTVTELIPEARFVLLGIGAPFWGLVFGIAASLLLEPGDFRRPAAAAAPAREQPATPQEPERPRPQIPAWVFKPEEKPEPAEAAATAEPAATGDAAATNIAETQPPPASEAPPPPAAEAPAPPVPETPPPPAAESPAPPVPETPPPPGATAPAAPPAGRKRKSVAEVLAAGSAGAAPSSASEAVTRDLTLEERGILQPEKKQGIEAAAVAPPEAVKEPAAEEKKPEAKRAKRSRGAGASERPSAKPTDSS